MSTNLLLIGEPLGAGLETYELAVELGYVPTHVVWTSSAAGSDNPPAVTVADLTAAQRSWPAILVGNRRYADLDGTRIDQRWIESARRCRAELEALGITRWVTLIHPTASVSPSARVGAGVAIGPMATVASRTIVGDFVRIGRSSSVGHHCRIGDYSRLGPGVITPGGVSIAAGVVVGPGVVFLNDIQVAEGALIGAGSVVTHHIRGPVQVMGNPARVLRRPLALARKSLKSVARKYFKGTRLFHLLRKWYRTGEIPAGLRRGSQTSP